MRLSALLGTKVTTASGESLGRVHDVRARWDERSGPVVTGLLVGRLGVLERLGLGAPQRAERLRGHDAIPWRDVLEAGPHGVIVRDPPS